ncbi:nucleotidyltransferase family protein [Novipirellula artificiosorum]|uniref:Molybdenum cofactor cytidylyltransferase n=1 Tax=Novipirellula artificiosorum TaxID=2528016 RepID=A0A5C6DNQ2_9BACT|nr:nucleotidyltransferase family protein [Novipirellula artificiosorum]TWU38232.1 Molybdenum cofactor cytidylyltransferase [Novipirellula artificiosorum]
MISAIVLAAGRSRRMGTQKMVLPMHGKPMIAHTVDTLLQTQVEQVLVVVGRDKQLIVDTLRDRNVQCVVSPDANEEMLTSVRTGLHALTEPTTAVIVALGDQPAIQVDVVTQMIRCFLDTGAGIIAPVFEGRRGHPLLISIRYRDEILTEFEGLGLRGLLVKHAQDVVELPVACASILDDIDTQADYWRVLQAMRKGCRE